MSSALLRSGAVHRLCRSRPIPDFGDSIGASIFRNHQQSRTTFSHIFRGSKQLEPCRRTTFSLPYSTSSYTKVGFVGWYLSMVKSRPIITKGLTSALIYTAADLSAQTIVGSSADSYDFVRTSRMAAYGLIVLGPSLHFWFNYMSRAFPHTDVVSTLKKILMGQTTYGPVMTCIFFSLNASLKGETGGEIIARLKRDLLPTMINGLMYWPVCDFITFKFIPVHLQPLASNSFSYVWTIYLTYMASLETAAA